MALNLTNGCTATLGFQFRRVVLAWFSDTPIRSLSKPRKQKSFLGHWSTSIEPRVFSDEDFLQSEVSEKPKKTGIWTQGSKPKRSCLLLHVHGEEGSRELYVYQLSQEHIGTREWWSGERKSNLLIPVTESINCRQEGRSVRWWVLMRCSPFKPLLLNITKKRRAEYSFKSKQEILWSVYFWSAFVFRQKDGKGEHCLSRVWWAIWRAGWKHWM